MGEPKSSYQLSDILGIYQSGVRRHLEDLEKRGIVKSFFKKAIGRPKKIYSISPEGHELFSKRYDLLLTSLVNKIKEVYGDNVLQSLLASIATELSSGFTSGAEDDSIEGRVEKVVEVLNNLGYQASWKTQGESIAIQAKNCIFCRTAREHPDAICQFDTMLIKNAVGDVNVRLDECIAHDSNVCTMVLEKPKST